MSKINRTKFVILGLLSHEPMSGYDIKKQLESGLSHFWNESFGQIYPSLKHLLDNESIIIFKEDKNNRNQKIYSITEKGKEELKEWLLLPVEEEKLRYEILLKLYFGNHVPIEANLNHISEFKKRNIVKLKEVTFFEENLRSILKNSLDHKFYLSTVLCGKKVYKAYIEWCDEVIELLRSDSE